jgi:hypothetical protein
METTAVNFKKPRDFGEIFNSSFNFIIEEFKPLGKAILLYALPFLIIASILGVIVNIQQQEFMNSIRNTDLADSDPFAMLGGTYKYTFLLFLVYVIGLCVLQSIILGYVKLYITRGKGQFTTEEVWTEIKPKILPVLGISFVIFLLVMVGFILCVIPGIILGVSLSLILPAYFYEDKGFGHAFNRSFQLTGQKWWLTFALILVSYILVYVLMLLLSIPSILLGFKSLFAFARNEELHFSTGYYIMNSITTLLGYLLVSVPLVIMIFNYYSLVEIKERPSLHEKIEQIN